MRKSLYSALIVSLILLSGCASKRAETPVAKQTCDCKCPQLTLSPYSSDEFNATGIAVEILVVDENKTMEQK